VRCPYISLAHQATGSYTNCDRPGNGPCLWARRLRTPCERMRRRRPGRQAASARPGCPGG